MSVPATCISSHRHTQVRGCRCPTSWPAPRSSRRTSSGGATPCRSARMRRPSWPRVSFSRYEQQVGAPVVGLCMVHECNRVGLENQRLDRRGPDGQRGDLRGDGGGWCERLFRRCPRGGKRVAGRPRVPGSRDRVPGRCRRSEEHTSELQSLMRISYAVFCLQKQKKTQQQKKQH